MAGEVLTILIVAAIAYAVLAFRKRAGVNATKPKRVLTKQPVDPPGRQPDFLNMLRDQLRGESVVEDDRE